MHPTTDSRRAGARRRGSAPVVAALVGAGAFVLIALLPLLPLGDALHGRLAFGSVSLAAEERSASLAAGQPFVFAASGDFRANADTSATLGQIVPSGAEFFLALGDFSYNDIPVEADWCNYVKNIVGPTYPFELISGNHEQDGELDHVNNFRQCLPDRLGTIVGDYAKQYYFDYNGLARFILVAPDIRLDGELYNYGVGTPRYNWLSQSIDDARARGIPWVIVAMHRHCVAAGIYPCEIDPDVFNLLLSKKVDLIMHGHTHNYQRSKQLGLGAGCAAFVPDSFNSACVVDDGADNAYTKGAGSVDMILGTTYGSTVRSMSEITTSDPEVPYFASLMGGNMNKRNGIGRFSVSASQIRFDFVPSTNTSSFADSYVITAAGGSTPTPSATSTPQSSATATPRPSATSSPLPSVTPSPQPTRTPTPLSTPTATTLPAGTPTPGDGLTGAYFDNSDLTGLVFTRVDPTVNFNWGSGSPAPSMGADTFSVRWTGFVVPRFSQTYRFYARTDDGVRVWVNNVRIIDNWQIQAATERSGTIALTANQRYPITVEYYDNTQVAIAELRWSSASQPKQIIPRARLYSH